MKWKNRLTNYNFWISLISAVLLILQAFNIAYVSEIATAVLGLLVVIGIISDPTKISVDATKTKKDEVDLLVKPIEGNKAQVIENTLDESISLQTNEVSVNSEIPNNSETKSFVWANESDFQTIINPISKEIEKATEKLKDENKQIANDLIEFASNTEQVKLEQSEIGGDVKNSNVQAENTINEVSTEKTLENLSVYNIVN